MKNVRIIKAWAFLYCIMLVPIWVGMIFFGAIGLLFGVVVAGINLWISMIVYEDETRKMLFGK